MSNIRLFCNYHGWINVSRTIVTSGSYNYYFFLPRVLIDKFLSLNTKLALI